MKQKKKTTLSENDSLRLRVMQAKSALPNGGKGYRYGTIIEHEFGAMSETDKELLHSVWNLREADEAMTVKIEKLIEIILQ